MYCETPEQARVFGKYLHSIGRRWSNTESYIETNYEYEYNEEPLAKEEGAPNCFNYNKGTWGNKAYYGEDEEYDDFERLVFTDFDWTDFGYGKTSNLLEVEFTRIRNVVVMEVINQPAYIRGKGELHFHDGITLFASSSPELEGESIWLRGTNDKFDNEAAVMAFETEEQAIERLVKYEACIESYGEALKEHESRKSNKLAIKQEFSDVVKRFRDLAKENDIDLEELYECLGLCRVKEGE